VRAEVVAQVVEWLCDILKALDSIPSTTNKKYKNKNNKTNKKTT
jgi:hypothetical protein